MLEFKILQVCMCKNKVLGYVIHIQGQKQRYVSKVEAISLFNNYKCINANLIKTKKGVTYIKGVGIKSMQVEVQPKKKVINNVYCNTNLKSALIKYVPELDTGFETERFVVDVLQDIMVAWLKDYNSVWYKSIAISGVRRIGKSTSMKQLYNKNIGKSAYIDGTVFNGDMYATLEELYAQGVKFLFVDEVCKLDYASRGELISLTKCGLFGMLVIFTGSTPALVHNTAYSICDCHIIELQPIMYIERLSWKYKKSLFDVIKVSTYDNYYNWIRTGDLHIKPLQYIQGIIQDTINSYNGNDFSAFKILVQKRQITDTDIRNLFLYVMLCQLLYIQEQNKYVDVKMVVAEEKEKAQEVKLLLKQIQALKNSLFTDSITAFCDMLEDAHLVKRVYVYDNQSIVQLEKVYGVRAYVWELPQMIQDYLHLGFNDLVSDWIEHSLLIKTTYYYENVGKYRAKGGTSEVDIVFSYNLLNFQKGMFEIKNRPLKADRPTKYSYQNIGIENIQEFILTCKDKAYMKINMQEYPFSCRLRNDILTCILELGYIMRVRDVDNVYTIQQMIQRFGIELLP